MILVNRIDIQKRLRELAVKINNEFDEVTLLIILTGGVYAGVDLSKYITVPLKMEFVKISSYGDAQENGIIQLEWISAKKGLNLGNVLIVDDICDTGNTLEYLINYIKNNYTYQKISTLTLLDKPSRRQTTIKVDYVGFEIPDVFVYGYGLDDKGYYRNLQDIIPC